MNLSYHDIARAVGAAYNGTEGTASRISTDSRDITPGCVFIALEGERFDGHDYAAKALELGAALAVVSKPVNAPPERLICVPDTRCALLDIAHLHRMGLDVKVVGITGSVGKTTTKEFTACVLEAGFNTLKTEQNLNNEVGLSHTLFRLDSMHRAAVLEIAMDGPGQIAPLSRAAAPHIAVVTKIGVTHLEKMGTRENIRDEKLSIRAGLADGGVLILNGDEPLLRGFKDARLKIITYGLENESCDVYGTGLHEASSGTAFRIHYRGGIYDAHIPALGGHNASNALAAFAAGVSAGISPQNAARALGAYSPAGMRQRRREHAGFTVIEDCYNAGPDSMEAALKTLAGMRCRGAGKKIAVLSDMLELGPDEEKFHADIGVLAAKLGIDYLLCTGKLSAAYAEGAKKAGMKNALHFSEKDDLFGYLKGILNTGSIVWFKASRGMKLETVMERLYNEI